MSLAVFWSQSVQSCGHNPLSPSQTYDFSLFLSSLNLLSPSLGSAPYFVLFFSSFLFQPLYSLWCLWKVWAYPGALWWTLHLAAVVCGGHRAEDTPPSCGVSRGRSGCRGRGVLTCIGGQSLEGLCKNSWVRESVALSSSDSYFYLDCYSTSQTFLTLFEIKKGKWCGWHFGIHPWRKSHPWVQLCRTWL